MLEYIEIFLQFKTWIILFIIYLIYKLGTLKHNLHVKLGHKGPPPLPYFGNFLDLYRMGFHEFDRMCLMKYGRIYPLYFGNIPCSMIADEELLKQILIKEAKCFTDRMDLGLIDEITDKSLLMLKGKDWERVRNLVSPTFTSGKLRKMSPLISDAIQLLKQRLSLHPLDTPLDIKEFYGALTIDVIARTMFGMNLDSQANPNNMFVYHTKKLSSVEYSHPFIMISFIFPELTKIIAKLFPKKNFFDSKTIEFFSVNLQKAINERQKSVEEYNDFLAFMLSVHKEIDENDSGQLQNTKSLTNQEIISQIFIFLFAGFETTATTLTFVSYLLAMNPEIQTELYNEIVHMIGADGDIKYETLMNMPFLDSVINETLRLYPAVERIDRVCVQETTLITSDNKKIVAKKGDIFAYSIYAIHRDSTRWDNPEVFNPERFAPENKNNIRPYSFMPFGQGPRNCVGMRFALLEVKWAIVSVLQKFQFLTCPETPERLIFRFTDLTSTTKPIILRLARRE